MRLRRVVGQIGGIQRMLDANRYCVDVLLQIAAVQAALGEVGRVILTAHVETCLADALRSDSARERQKKVDEVMDLFGRSSLLGSRSGRGKRRKETKEK